MGIYRGDALAANKDLVAAQFYLGRMFEKGYGGKE